MKSKRITFKNRSGNTLSARLELPVSGKPSAYALFAHCFTCSKNIKAAVRISRALSLEGIGVLRFDFTGLGESEGEFADTNFSSNVSDLVDAANFLEMNYDAPQILIGHSLGGAAVLQAASQIASTEAVATIGAPAEPVHVTALLTDKTDEIQQSGEAQVTLAGRPFKIKKQFLDDLEATHMKATIQNMKKPLIIFHSPLDTTVGIDHATRIYQAARHPKSFVSLDRADHLLMREEDSRYVGTMVATWASKYISNETSTDAQGAKGITPTSDHQVVVVTGQEHYYTEIMARQHPMLADEPVSYGGTDSGPTPYDHLLAALGSCTSITLRMYADRKQWPVEKIAVGLNIQKIHASDCEECENETGYVDQITRDIELTGDLNEEQKARMLQIADKCPVHKTLHSQIIVKTNLKE